jgi:hypothetical protein
MVDWTVSPSCQVTFFCRNCGQPEWRHVYGKCLFEASMFAYETHAEIAKRLLEERFLGSPLTPQLHEEMAAFLKMTLEDLKRARIPENDV